MTVEFTLILMADGVLAQIWICLECLAAGLAHKWIQAMRCGAILQCAVRAQCWRSFKMQRRQWIVVRCGRVRHVVGVCANALLQMRLQLDETVEHQGTAVAFDGTIAFRLMAKHMARLNEVYTFD